MNHCVCVLIRHEVKVLLILRQDDDNMLMFVHL